MNEEIVNNDVVIDDNNTALETDVFNPANFLEPNYVEGPDGKMRVDFGLNITQKPKLALDISDADVNNDDKKSYDEIKKWLKIKLEIDTNKNTWEKNMTETTNLTFVFTSEADYNRYLKGEYSPPELQPMSMADWEKYNHDGNWDELWFKYEISDFGKSMQNEQIFVVNMTRADYERTWGIPYIAPIGSVNQKGGEEKLGQAVQNAHKMRPGSQIYFLTDAEVAAIQAGEGFTAQPANLEFYNPNSGFLESDYHQLGQEINSVIGARTDMRPYVLTDADIAKFNGRDINEVQEENNARIEEQEKARKEEDYVNSPWGKFEKIISKISEYTAKLGHKINDFITSKFARVEPPVIVEADTSGLEPSDLSDVPVPVDEASSKALISAVELNSSVVETTSETSSERFAPSLELDGGSYDDNNLQVGVSL